MCEKCGSCVYIRIYIHRLLRWDVRKDQGRLFDVVPISTDRGLQSEALWYRHIFKVLSDSYVRQEVSAQDRQPFTSHAFPLLANTATTLTHPTNTTHTVFAHSMYLSDST